MRPFDDAVASLVVLTTGLRDHHRDAFDAAKADLLRLTRDKASALAYVRRIVAAELNGPMTHSGKFLRPNLRGGGNKSFWG